MTWSAGLLVLGLACGSPSGARAQTAPGSESPWPADAAPQPPASARGEELLARLKCTACHRADAAVEARILPLAAPRLDDVGARRAPGWLRDMLGDPRGVHPDGDMPDLLGGLPEPERVAARDELVAFLASLGGPLRPAALAPEAWRVQEGSALYERLGCRACHLGEDDHAGLARATTLPVLAAELREPHAWRASGGMPDMQLSDDEAWALAASLLAPQRAAGPRSVTRGAGLRAEVYELDEWPDALPDWSRLEPVRVTTAARVDTTLRPREEQYGLRLEGVLRVDPACLDADGVLRLWTRSDDGSRLWLDGELVVDNDGPHAPVTVVGEAVVTPGWHALVVEMFEAAGGDELDAGFVDADGSQWSFPPAMLAHVERRWGPAPAPRRALGDADTIARGRARFERLGCAGCHPLEGVDAPEAPPLQRLGVRFAARAAAAQQGRARDPVPPAGCLADEPAPGLPRYALSNLDRQHLARSLSRLDVLAMPPTPGAFVGQTLALHGCTNCHPRGDHPGPAAGQRARFGGDHDLGDEGRLPPDLTGVGARLRPAWLREVLADGARARPYMHTRMPRFGFDAAHTARLAEAFALADGAPEQEREPAPDTALIEAGRRLAGRDGLSCISCHTTLGHPGPGVPATDLGDMHARLRPDWLRRWLRDPIALREGTRMPTFFDAGRSVLTGVLDGDAEAQIEALLAYLSLGDQLPLPAGVSVDRAAYTLVPVERAVPAAVFMRGLSARVLAVGHPERVHVAYDLHHVRMALAWRGDFLDAEGTWRGRAGQLESPAGESVRAFPAGPLVARLADAAAPWPEATGAEAGWRMTGQSRDAHNRPTFRSTDGELLVEESAQPVLDVQDAVLVRRVRLALADGAAPARVWLRAALDDAVDAAAPHPRGAHYVTGDGLDLLVRGGEPVLLATGAGVELRVGVDLRPGRPVDLELELRW